MRIPLCQHLQVPGRIHEVDGEQASGVLTNTSQMVLDRGMRFKTPSSDRAMSDIGLTESLSFRHEAVSELSEYCHELGRHPMSSLGGSREQNVEKVCPAVSVNVWPRSVQDRHQNCFHHGRETWAFRRRNPAIERQFWGTKVLYRRRGERRRVHAVGGGAGPNDLSEDYHRYCTEETYQRVKGVVALMTGMGRFRFGS